MHSKTRFAIVALAGAVTLAGCSTIEEEAVDATSDTYNAMLTGANEVGAGDPNGYGKAEISVTDGFGQVCWELKDVTGIDPPTAAHIHFGRAGRGQRARGVHARTVERRPLAGLQGCP